jgi:membrane protease YdiL (CAAX protease family)
MTTRIPFEPLLVIASWMPNLAAFIVLGLILREDGGVRKLLAGWGKWNVGLGWYLAALSPFMVASLAVGVYLLLGGNTAAPEQPVTAPIIIGAFVISLITGATGEELGWRGFLLPRLQVRFIALVASLIVGVVWGFWHLPLWFIPGQLWGTLPFWAFALAAISTSIIYTWVVNNTARSMVMASLIHLSTNFGMNIVFILGLTPPHEYIVISSIIYTVYAIAVTIVAGPSKLSRKLDSVQRPT